jgi:hypothetical protein
VVKNRFWLLLGFAVSAVILVASRPVLYAPSTDGNLPHAGSAAYDSVRATLVGYRWPTEEFLTITSSFADFRTTHFHSGIDISTRQRKGYRVFASREGYVVHISVSPYGYGKMVLVRHPDGFTTAYAHLQRFSDTLEAVVRAFQHMQDKYAVEVNFEPHQFPVVQGDLIAYTGDTGVGSAHLHFEIHDEQFNAINPLLVPEFSQHINDSAPPEIRKLLFTPLDCFSLVDNGLKAAIVNATKINNREYRFGTIVRCTGTIGLEIHAMDRSDDTWYRSTATDLELFIDSISVFSSKISRIAFYETKQIALHYDWEMREKRRGYFQKLYVEPGNKQPFYQGDSTSFSGLKTDRFSEGYHNLRIVASDVFGNSSELRGTVAFNHPPEIKVSPDSERTSLNIWHSSPLKSITVASLAAKGWTRHVYRASDFTRNPTEFVLPPEVHKSSVFKIEAENVYGTKSLPAFLISGRSNPKTVSFRFKKEFVRDFLSVTLTTTALLPHPPILLASSEDGDRTIPLNQVELFKYIGIYTPSPADRGRIRILAMPDSSDTNPRTLDEFALYPVTPERGGVISLGTGEFTLRFGEDGVYRPMYFHEEQYIEGYSVLPSSVLLNEGATVQYALPRLYPGKVGLFLGKEILDWTDSGQKNVLEGTVDRFVGRFSLIEDNIPPEISRVQTLYSKGEVRISFRVLDRGAGIEPDSIKLRVDDDVLIGEFDPYSHYVQCAESHPLLRGSHTITIEVSDRMANRAIIRKTLAVSR